MKKSAFELLHGMEGSWWYRARERVARNILSKFIGSQGQKVLDYGAGYGGMFGLLSRYGRVNAFEIDDSARAACFARGYERVFDSTEEALDPGNGHTLIALFDVVEHIEDDEGTIALFSKALPSGGRAIINVPAYEWLWSIHDEEHSHFRRYTKSQMVSLLEDRGFEIEYAGYWNAILFIPTAIVRLLGFSGGSAFRAPRWLDSLLYSIVWLESLLIPSIPLPFGTSVIILARKI